MIRRLEGLVEQVCWACLAGPATKQLQKGICPRLPHRCTTAEACMILHLPPLPTLGPGQAEPQCAGGCAQGHVPRCAPRPGQVQCTHWCLVGGWEEWTSCRSVVHCVVLLLRPSMGAQFAHPDPISAPLPAGVEVSPGVFQDVPAEVHRRGEYVYAHTPTGVPGEGRGACAGWLGSWLSVWG